MTWWYFYSLLAALLLTTAVLLEKKSLNKIHALEFSTESSFYGLILSLFLLPWVRWDFSLATYGLLALQGITALLAFLTFNQALRHSDVSEVSPLTNLDTIATLIFALLLLRDIPSGFQFVGIGFIFLGAYFLELKSPGRSLSPFRAFTRSRSLWLLLVSMALYGLNKVLGKILLFTVSPLSLVFFAYVVFFMGYSVIDWFSFKENVTKLSALLRQHGPGMFLSSFALFGYRLVMTFAVAAGSVALTTAIARTSTFFTALAGGKLFAESGLQRKLMASAIILAGVLMIVL